MTPEQLLASDIVRAEFLMRGYLLADNILGEIISVKNHVYKIKIVGKQKESYCIYRNGVFSHGETLKQAKESLIYKISNRDTSEYTDWNLDTIKTVPELISCYRKITGACEFGVRDFLSKHKTKNKLSIKEVCKLTKNSFGNLEFCKFFNYKGN